MSVELELLPSGRVAVRFPYDPANVRKIKTLRHRRWVKAEKYWEVLMSELPDLIHVFALTPREIPAEIRETLEKSGGDEPLEIRLDPLDGKIVGSGFPLAAVDKATSFRVPGYKFSPRYKSGKWDGRRHLFSPLTQKFPAGLWPRVEQALRDAGVKWKLRRSSVPRAADLAFAPPSSELRPYQQEALAAALKARRGIIQIATGGGKTLLAAHLIRELSRPTVFFVHTRELLHQTRDVFLRELGDPIGILGDAQVEVAPIMVATIQTAARLFDVPIEKDEEAEPGEESAEERPLTRAELREAALKALSETHVVIFDECHHVPADTAFRLSRKMKKAAFRFGLSATPWTSADRDMLLEAALGSKVCSISASDLIDSGYLVAPEIQMRAAPVVAIPRRRPNYAQVYRAAIVENLMRNSAIALAAREETANGRTVLILVAQVRHGESLLSLLREARFSHGSLASEERREHLDALQNRRIPILIATTLADEGLDIPTLDTLILAGGGKSAVRAYQRIGRTLRTAEGKSRARVIDFFDRAPWVDEHSLARLKLYRREPAFRVSTHGFRA